MNIDYVGQLISSGLNEESPIDGITSDELLDLEGGQKFPLPGAYKQFMLQCGKSAGLYLRDIDYSYPYVKEIKSNLIECLAEYELSFDAKDSYFFFLSYQGSQYSFFDCNQGDDPPVYSLSVSDLKCDLISDSFSDFVRLTISQYKNSFYADKSGYRSPAD